MDTLEQFDYVTSDDVVNIVHLMFLNIYYRNMNMYSKAKLFQIPRFNEYQVTGAD